MSLTLSVFCKVVDNYGDIGICWRLARQLAVEHGVAVTLWVDDLASFRRICPSVDVAAATQTIESVAVRHWCTQDGQFQSADIANIVIEFFGCDIPPGYIEAMAQCEPRPVWLNLEGLTAEEWVEGCHTLPSSHPRLPLTKHFYFPGFTGKTGGLLRETGLAVARHAFQHDGTVRSAFLSRLGMTQQEQQALLVSLFCYPYAPVFALLQAWQHGGQPVTCVVPEGVAADAVQAFFGKPVKAGDVATHGALTLRVLPFIPQPDYDRLLWACDLNFVRGEDSWVRAQWAGKPFVWHIYAQDENLHHKKLRAFLQRYSDGQPALDDFSLCWNGAADADAEGQGGWAARWQRLHAALPSLAARAAVWEQQMLAHGDLASNLLQFANSLR
ncbi:elongation factor P maturation arginine rhamnosyltransferase EarP [Pseudoduganella ginsengisoli]|uniref:Protein-arginine rhamnosyltransferase n=1 Tax=Pseudoduganella ginsengisoli TaxID=1462440 RepID=A0A6L6PYX0_9BURK|nr:elongation factor P maturation arginine rhamnosyltransferase EarP [Pseudoduganella ginsengisoli]MTW02354.1 elongation factor P maturation arginine rhamnosyltransferase EarP [Pseudoduganella ginsengisoli]